MNLMRLALFTTCLAVTLPLFTTLSAFAAAPDQDWPTFRGSSRTAVSPDKGLLQQWPKEGPKLLWDSKGAGRGYSSLAIAGNRIFTLGDAPSTAEDKDEYLLCFDRDTGSALWKHKIGSPWTDGKPDWQSSRATPTIDGDSV